MRKKDKDLTLADNFGLFKQILYFLFKKNLVTSAIKYLGRCTCIKKELTKQEKKLKRQKPPEIKESRMKWLKWNMNKELDLKIIISKLYAFEKNF